MCKSHPFETVVVLELKHGRLGAFFQKASCGVDGHEPEALQQLLRCDVLALSEPWRQMSL